MMATTKGQWGPQAASLKNGAVIVESEKRELLGFIDGREGAYIENQEVGATLKDSCFCVLRTTKAAYEIVAWDIFGAIPVVRMKDYEFRNALRNGDGLREVTMMVQEEAMQ